MICRAVDYLVVFDSSCIGNDSLMILKVNGVVNSQC